MDATTHDDLQIRDDPRVVRIRLLGEFSVHVGDNPVIDSVGGRRDPLRLAQFLALAPSRRMHREQVIDALWPEAALDTVANRLHKAAHYLRKALGWRTSVVLAADTVALLPGPDAEVETDVVRFDALASEALDPTSAEGEATKAAAAALDLYRGDLLTHDPYEEWTFHPRQRLQLRHRELLRKTGRYAELVAVDPLDEDAHVGLMRQLLADGDRAGVLHQFTALAELLERELDVGPSAESVALRDAAATGGGSTSQAALPQTVADRAATLATQQVHFCHTTDGVRLAYAKSGSGAPLVKAANWMTHLDHDWDSPVWRHWWEALSRHHTLVRYDERGCGLSDWDVDRGSFALEPWVRDLETVVDALGLERFPLLGVSQGGPVAITYAARHPDRVSHVIVYGTAPLAAWGRSDDARRREFVALGELIRTSWGTDEPGFRQVYDQRFLPDGPIETWRAFDDLQRRSTSARNAYRMWQAFGSLDCTEAARQLDIPTLILHAGDDQLSSFEEAEHLRSLIPGSRLVRLASNNHILQADEPAFGAFIDEVGRFLRT